MKKIYSSPYIQVVIVNRKDVIATSPTIKDRDADPTQSNLAPGRGYDID